MSKLIYTGAYIIYIYIYERMYFTDERTACPRLRCYEVSAGASPLAVSAAHSALSARRRGARRGGGKLLKLGIRVNPQKSRRDDVLANRTLRSGGGRTAAAARRTHVAGAWSRRRRRETHRGLRDDKIQF